MLERRKECIAMLLAGGQGSRLKVLTSDIAKPAVPFGGKYRIIDFPLSNCVNSGIDTVGILTQYQPLVLNAYVGNGQPWGLNRNYGGARILPPYAQSDRSEWYKGTANAIYQNMHFIDMYNPEYVLILSGDHIYKMDYSKMLEYHKEKNADCTIAAIDVPMEETHRFGIINTNPDHSIYEFEEKPEHAKSTNANMGIYIFNWKILKKYLEMDEQDPNSSNDFGKNILPKLLEDKQRMFAYPFSGYWKDVGTLDSLWEANMDLINPSVPIELKDDDFKIYTRNYAKPPSFVSGTAKIENSIVAEGCVIRGTVENSVIFTGCVVEEGAVIKDSVIMPNILVKQGAQLNYTIIGENAVIGKEAVIGRSPKDYAINAWGIAVVGTGRKIEDGEVVAPKQVL
ncbi:Glucose-1-phosphate adenylyltransferase [uncultured Ruminococcus sp.]|uniref:Glucose-1-phosphate adenylyltransferase n=1 Tax=Massiliimalia timonensis TaxID=1987501 RepID=A0A8J6PI34_9FIRM|nr:glucose-1-phosphate adenylyltransferase [Massiliimalia timonensis]MBC8610475.1 glucose-1-phosphate adenylyltransferase [Massiliimalia timonensis]MBS7174746.1 glucose-1-phosphate adenylyltransferase [Clostridiales bacterium]SCH45548.1 Glucose-1-phosphate adenylyltransferase [uncultured Ruminococcus sp.]SCI13683.1 Glucose-1-phosphate adenylyltransferase [uncultured Clostridium sp.]